MADKSPPPSVSHNVDGMSAEEMRNALYQQLSNQGLLDSLKSQLRNYLISELSGGKSRKENIDEGKTKANLQKKIVDSLIYKYLCENGYDYSVGVFLPEVEMSKREILSTDELAQLLHIPNSLLRTSGGKSLLQLAVSNSTRMSKEYLAEESTQTDTEPHICLSDKLSNIDMEYSNRQSKFSSSLVEERLLSYQKKAERAANEKAQQDLERWKQLEIDMIQITEREKQTRQLHDRQKQLEDEYRRKMAAVTDRERSLAESVKLEFESVQRETFQQRQQLLQQSEQLRQRENELRDQKEQTACLQRINEEKLEKMEQMMNKRETELKAKELHIDNTLRTQQERCKLEEKMRYDSKYRELKAFEDKLKDKEAAHERDRQNLLSANERTELQQLRQKNVELDSLVRRYSTEIAGLEMKVAGLQERLAKMFDYEVIKESNISLKKDLELTKDRLDCLMKDNSLLQEKYEHLVIDGRDKAGLGEIMLIKTQMQRERDKALDDKVILEHKLNQMETKFNEQLRKNQNLVKEFEIQTDRQKYMNKEYMEMCKKLGHTGMKLGHTDMAATRKTSPVKEPSFYDTSLHKSLPPELALEADWMADVSSGADISTATEESIVAETRKRLECLTKEADQLHSAFHSLTRHSPTKTVSYLQQSTQKTSRPCYSKLTVDSDISFSDYPAVGDRLTRPPAATLAATEFPLSEHAVHSQPQSQADQFNRPTPNKPAQYTMLPPKDPIIPPQSVETHVLTPTTPAVSTTVVSNTENLDNKPSDSLVKPASPVRAPQVSVTSLAEKWKDHAAESNEEPIISTNKITEIGNTLHPSAPVSQDVAFTPAAVSLDNHWKSEPAVSHTKAAAVTDTSSVTTHEDKAESKVEHTTSEQPASKAADDMTGIDPVMQRYMMMIKEQKGQDKTKMSPSAGAQTKSNINEENSISEVVSQAKSDEVATDEDFW